MNEAVPIEKPSSAHGHPEVEPDGLYQKYTVSRVDGQDLVGCRYYDSRYLVLDLSHDPEAQRIALEYAESVAAKRPQYASDLRELVKTLRERV